MAKDVGSTIASMAGTIAREVAESISDDGHRDGKGHLPFGKEGGQLSGARGLAAGAALATALPLAGKAAKKLALKRLGGSPVDAVKGVGDGITEKLTKGAKDAVGEKVEQVGGAPGIAKEVGKKDLGADEDQNRSKRILQIMETMHHGGKRKVERPQSQNSEDVRAVDEKGVPGDREDGGNAVYGEDQVGPLHYQ